MYERLLNKSVIADEAIIREHLREESQLASLLQKTQDRESAMREKYPFQQGKRFWAAAAFIAVVILAAGFWLGVLWKNQSSPLSPEQEKLAEIRSCIEEYYLFDTDAASQFTGLCKGLVDSLGDPYAKYFTPDELAQYLQTSEGELVGIGAVIQTNPKTEKVCITFVLPDGPAAAAGIQVNDILLTVGGMPVDQIPLEVLSWSHIIGETGTQVSLTVYRPSTDETLEFTVTREKVSFPSTQYRMMENQTGYLRIFEFSDYLPAEFISAIEALESQGMEQLVLDLRSNPGGSLDAAVKIADYLLPDFFVSEQGESLRASVVSLKDKRGRTEQYECVDGNSVEIPIVILVNEYSASASELLSGALRDYGRGALVGKNTFGKGISQSLLTLSDGSAVKLTNMQYFTPSGFALHGVGLMPDVVVEEDLSVPDQDNQLQAALQTLEEMRQGKRKIPMSVKQKKEPTAPKAFLEQAKHQTCKIRHLPVTRQEIRGLLSQLCTDYGGGAFCRTDSWELDESRGYEWSVTLDLSFDEDMWITVRFDPVTEKPHQIELYLPTQKAVAGTLDVLETIDPSMSQGDRNKLRQTLPVHAIGQDRTLEEILKKKDYSVYAGYEDGSLSVIIE